MRERPQHLGAEMNAGFAGTYRVQFRNGFDFAAARRIVPYLARLGISHAYLSPVFAARSGSTHGYDVIDPTRIDPALGTEAEFRDLLRHFRDHGIATILDIVPNHMAASLENPWWRDVLAKGTASKYARYFDIDWSSSEPGMEGKVYLPYLDRPLPEAVKAGLVRLERDPTPTIIVGELRLPVREGTAADPAHGRAFDHGITVEQNSLDAVLAAQHYVLGPWQEAPGRINFRRFFDINDLVCLRIEERSVFEAVHGPTLELVREGLVTGLRVDHIDGLYDPRGYLELLQRVGEEAGLRFVAVEKILADHEALPPRWPVDGTTGYEFADRVGRLLVEENGLGDLDQTYRSQTGSMAAYETLLVRQKRKMLETLFPGIFERLARELQTLVRADELEPVRELLSEFTCRLRVYRTYVDDEALSEEDRNELDHAFSTLGSDHDPRLVEEMRNVLGLETEAARRFVRRWQQYTGPLMAKGHEDTGLYLYHRLIALNEVGSRPDSPALDPALFHDFNVLRAARWPRTLNATSTHDTKRSEDIRARLLALSELPAEWDGLVRALVGIHAPYVQTINDKSAPTPNLHYLLLQTIVGSWPLEASTWDDYVQRLQAFIVKAAREGKRRTSWLEPDDDYEVALGDFVRKVLSERSSRELLATFSERLARAGMVNALSMLTLKLGSPGVPDIYRGCETWDLSLVDPDNRRPVDFGQLESALDDVDTGSSLPSDFLPRWQDGRVKLATTLAGLRFRARHAAAFSGAYEPLVVRGPRAGQLIAFRRTGGGDEVIVVAPRHVAQETANGRLPLREYWEGTTIEVSGGLVYRNVLDDARCEAREGRLLVRDALRRFPAALLEPS